MSAIRFLVPALLPALWIAVAGIAPEYDRRADDSKVSGAEPLALRGWLEPYRDVGVAAAESGVIAKIGVERGAQVVKDQWLADLDADVQRAQLESAQHLAAAEGSLRAAEQDAKWKESRYRQLAGLQQSGAAPPKEVVEAAMAWRAAEARWKGELEQRQLRALEARRAAIALDRRRVLSPIDGVVAEVLVREGEFVSPARPVVVRVIQLDPIIATVPIGVAAARKLRRGDTARVWIDDGSHAEGTIESIGPEVDRASGLTPVRIRIANPDGRFLAGQRCGMPHPPRAHRTSRD